MLDTGQSLILSNLQNVVFEIDMWDLSRENNSSTVSCLVKPAPQVCWGNHQAGGGEGGGGVEGLQVAGGQDARSDTAASASQRSQAEVEGEAWTVAVAYFMFFLFPALIS